MKINKMKAINLYFILKRLARSGEKNSHYFKSVLARHNYLIFQSKNSKPISHKTFHNLYAGIID